MEKFNFREATLEDFPKFHSLFKKSIHELFAKDYTPLTLDYIVHVSDSKSLIHKNLKSGNYVLFLAFHEEKIIGFLLTRKVFAGVAMAQWIAVNPRFHHKGIASKLIQLWEETAMNRGAHALQLWTGDRNIPFYKNRGFILGGRFPEAFFGFDINLFYKKLQEPQEENFLNGYSTRA